MGLINQLVGDSVVEVGDPKGRAKRIEITSGLNELWTNIFNENSMNKYGKTN